MNIETELMLLELDDPLWLSFIQSKPEASFFHHPVWAELIAKVYGYRTLVILQTDGDGKPVAGLPLIKVKSWLTGERYISLPFTDHCAPLTCSPTNLLNLTDNLQLWWEAENQPCLEIRSALPIGMHVHQKQTAVLHLLDLSPSQSKLFENLSKMHRRNIRIAEREGVQIKMDRSLEGVKKFYQLHLITRQRLGVPVQPWRFFRLLWEKVIARELGYVLLAYKDGQAIAGAVFLHWNNILIYKYGASNLVFSSLRSNNLLFWTAILWGCENKCHQIDFGRTDFDNQGLRNFKNGWGAIETPLIYSVFGDAPFMHADGFKRRLLAQIIRNSPHVVCRTIGELIYRDFA